MKLWKSIDNFLFGAHRHIQAEKTLANAYSHMILKNVKREDFSMADLEATLILASHLAAMVLRRPLL